MGNHNSGTVAALELVMRAERLLAYTTTGAVAAELGVDVSVIKKIRRGSHPQQQRIRELVRCPHCGGLVEAPCRLCSVRLTTPGELLEDLGDDRGDQPRVHV